MDHIPSIKSKLQSAQEGPSPLFLILEQTCICKYISLNAQMSYADINIFMYYTKHGLKGVCRGFNRDSQENEYFQGRIVLLFVVFPISGLFSLQNTST